MKLAFLAPLTLQTIQTAKRLGYDGLEASGGWMENHLLGDLEQNLPALRDALAENGLSVTAMTLFCNPMAMSAEEALNHFERAAHLARALGAEVISTFTGRENALTVDENLPLFAARFGPIAQLAADHGVRIAFEPWPGQVNGYGPYHWANLAATPYLWERLFDAVPHPALGLEYDASHLIWQGIDHLQAIREFAPRIYHVHAKDIVFDKARLKRVGVHGEGWWRFVIPGLGVINWPELFDALREVGYRGHIAVEHEDAQYQGDRWSEGLLIALKTLRPLVEPFPS